MRRPRSFVLILLFFASAVGAELVFADRAAKAGPCACGEVAQGGLGAYGADPFQIGCDFLQEGDAMLDFVPIGVCGGTERFGFGMDLHIEHIEGVGQTVDLSDIINGDGRPFYEGVVEVQVGVGEDHSLLRASENGEILQHQGRFRGGIEGIGTVGVFNFLLDIGGSVGVIAGGNSMPSDHSFGGADDFQKGCGGFPRNEGSGWGGGAGVMGVIGTLRRVGTLGGGSCRISDFAASRSSGVGFFMASTVW